ncbi:tetratricopeptide repeat protein [Nitratiruptor tergarcus]|uniref:Anaphase-promoting complex, cyclosome, subunit 3 n=1 Tax=Nitratiruptor tergarcus DSM 16512 TaxID=1069081 RepID=A0A1W1WUC7_9BACT|nr:CDC27 family protein [Nitratiruptor tergarcus]SMC09630.1 Anaphase-promoting complex, cyclosome, subunit 3 [Nitratiruptor tergarcus DSM 16512]
MHEYERLEQRWKVYNFKKNFKSFFLLSILFLLIGGAFYILKMKSSSSLKPKNISSNQKTINNVSHNKNFLAPALDFEKRLLNKKVINKSQKKSNRKQSNNKKKVTDKKATKNKPNIKNRSKKDTFKIETQTLSLKEMIRNFKKRPSAPLALLIAKKYFTKGEYKHALEWSIKSNELDKNLEESWILFAKSAYRIGDKKRAIKALQIIIRKNNSKEAKRLLRKISRGQKI